MATNMATNVTSVVPALPPPPGVTPNFVNPYSLGPIFYAVGGLMLFAMLALVSIRAWMKFYVLRKPYWDDLICGIGTLGTIFFFITICYCIAAAKYGRHIWNVPIEFLASRQFLVSSWIVTAWPSLISPFIKSGLFIMYLQIFSLVTWFRICCYIGIALLWLFYIPVWITLLYYTSPSPGQTWLQAYANPRFTRSLKLSVPVASVAFGFDLTLLILPISIVLQLQMSRQRKFAVSLMFMYGLSACIASAVSIVYRVKQNQNAPDVTWETFAIIFTQYVEMAVGVSISCMPPASMFYRKFCRPHLQYITRKSSGSDSAGKGFNNPDSRPKRKILSVNHIDTYDTLDEHQQEDEVPLGRDVELGNMKTTMTTVTNSEPKKPVELSDGINRHYSFQQWTEDAK